MADTEVRYPYFSVDHHADAAYIYLTPLSFHEGAVARTDEITPQINADYDTDGNVIGIEFLSLKIDFGKQFEWLADA
jgi:uncharacterized protein YuzE